MSEKRYKTFAEFGLEFTKDSGCATCEGLSCHNNVPSTFNGREYNVHISMNPEKTEFSIYATESANTVSGDVDANFDNEEDAVSFVCKNFEWFKCF